MSEPGVKRKSAATRRSEIARTALALAFEVGPAGVSTGMIADRLGISQPALYKHYRNKRDIWAGIGDDVAARIAANAARVQSADCSPAERIRMQVLDHLRLIETIPALPDIMLLRDRDESLVPLRDRVLAAMSGFRAGLAALVAEASASGQFSRGIDPNDAASLLMGLIQNLVLRMTLSRRPGGLVLDAERLLTLLLGGFMRTGAPIPSTAPSPLTAPDPRTAPAPLTALDPIKKTGA